MAYPFEVSRVTQLVEQLAEDEHVSQGDIVRQFYKWVLFGSRYYQPIATMMRKHYGTYGSHMLSRWRAHELETRQQQIDFFSYDTKFSSPRRSC